MSRSMLVLHKPYCRRQYGLGLMCAIAHVFTDALGTGIYFRKENGVRHTPFDQVLPSKLLHYDVYEGE